VGKEAPDEQGKGYFRQRMSQNEEHFCRIDCLQWSVDEACLADPMQTHLIDIRKLVLLKYFTRLAKTCLQPNKNRNMLTRSNDLSIGQI
jgi:hypothetical protein